MNKKRAIFFDNDGVLVRTENLFFQATRDTLRRFMGTELSEADHREQLIRHNMDPLHVIKHQKNLDDTGFSDLHQARLERYSQLLGSANIEVEGASEVIRNLAGKYVLGMVTGSKREQLSVLENRMDFYHLFDFVITAEDAPHRKPSPDLYLHAISRTGLAADRCLAVEDSEFGLKSAKSAGLECWVIPNESTRGSDFTSADKTIDSIRQVVPLLEDPSTAGLE